MIEIYTDGACRGNPGRGGWAALLLSGEHEREISGAEEHTTNNRMELTAVIRALEALKRPVQARVYTLTPVRTRFREKPAVIGGLVKPTTRSQA